MQKDGGGMLDDAAESGAEDEGESGEGDSEPSHESEEDKNDEADEDDTDSDDSGKHDRDAAAKTTNPKVMIQQLAAIARNEDREHYDKRRLARKEEERKCRKVFIRNVVC